MIGDLNIKSLRNKFEILEKLIKDKINIRDKNWQFFSIRHVVNKGYSTPFRLDRNQKGEGLLLYVLKDLPFKILKEYTPEKPIETFFVKINLRSKKWLLSCSSCSYNRNTKLIADHLHCIGRGIHFHSSKYDNFVVFGEINTKF